MGVVRETADRPKEALIVVSNAVVAHAMLVLGACDPERAGT